MTSRIYNEATCRRSTVVDIVVEPIGTRCSCLVNSSSSELLAFLMLKRDHPCPQALWFAASTPVLANVAGKPVP